MILKRPMIILKGRLFLTTSGCPSPALHPWNWTRKKLSKLPLIGQSTLTFELSSWRKLEKIYCCMKPVWNRSCLKGRKFQKVLKVRNRKKWAGIDNRRLAFYAQALQNITMWVRGDKYYLNGPWTFHINSEDQFKLNESNINKEITYIFSFTKFIK